MVWRYGTLEKLQWDWQSQTTALRHQFWRNSGCLALNSGCLPLNSGCLPLSIKRRNKKWETSEIQKRGRWHLCSSDMARWCQRTVKEIVCIFPDGSKKASGPDIMLLWHCICLCLTFCIYPWPARLHRNCCNVALALPAIYQLPVVRVYPVLTVKASEPTQWCSHVAFCAFWLCLTPCASVTVLLCVSHCLVSCHTHALARLGCPSVWALWPKWQVTQEFIEDDE